MRLTVKRTRNKVNVQQRKLVPCSQKARRHTAQQTVTCKQGTKEAADFIPPAPLPRATSSPQHVAVVRVARVRSFGTFPAR